MDSPAGHLPQKPNYTRWYLTDNSTIPLAQGYLGQSAPWMDELIGQNGEDRPVQHQGRPKMSLQDDYY
jgi:hypothetical protein